MTTDTTPTTPLPRAPQHLITTRATLTQCNHCHASILTGHSEGIPITVEAVPLTRTGELTLIAAGRTVTTLTHGGELWTRDRYRLRTPTRDLLLPTHRCNDPVPGHLRAPWPTPRIPAADGPPPF